MTSKHWNVSVDEESYKVEVELEGFSGKLSVKINGEVFELPPKLLTVVTGRRENFKLGDKLAILDIKPLCKITVVVNGETFE